MGLRLTVLGSGTSHGVPMIGCDCPVCRSADPRDRRTNASLLLANGERRVLIDCGRDFRAQALRHRLKRVDALLVTHAHYDHVAGIDDLRVFTGRQRGSLRVYGGKEHLRVLHDHTFHYLFEGNGHTGGGTALLELQPVDASFEAGGIEFRPIAVLHGNTEVFGYRFCDCAYLPDVSYIGEAARDALRGLKLLIIDSLRYRPHVSHLSVQQALSVIRDVAPEKALLSHICHDVSHAELDSRLAAEASTLPSVRVAYDGLELDL